MKKKKVSLTYKVLKWILKTFYPKYTFEGAENLPDEPCIIAGNHVQMHGPIVCEFYFPRERYTWCAGQMMELKEVPAYAFQDFWAIRPKWTHWFYRILSYLIAPLSVCVFNNAYTIGVYHDTRVVSTFKKTVATLEEGYSVVIFPEHAKEYNHIVYDFQDKFIDVARTYYKRTGKELQFVPMYISPRLKKAYLGKPTRFSIDAPVNEERARVRQYLMDGITQIACDLPEHKVVPYINLPKRHHQSNKKVDNHEKAGC